MRNLPEQRAKDLPLASFDFTIRDRPAQEQVSLLASLGYSGIATSDPDPDKVKAFSKVPAVRDGSFDFVGTLWMLPLDRPLDRPFLSRLIHSLSEARGFLWLMFGPQGWKRGAPLPPGWRDKVGAVVEMAGAEGVAVVYYPHEGTPLETAEQAADWNAGMGGRARVSLHLCHELKAANLERLHGVISAVESQLGAVTVNGADEVPDPPGVWEHTIQPLGQGSLDVRSRFVSPLVAAGYRGPFILHTYGLKGAPRVHLATSIQAWERWTQTPD